jgi:cyanate permease
VAVDELPGRHGAASRAGSLVAVFVAAACMRSAITALGPLLHVIGDDTGLSDTELGLLSSLPLLGFAGISPLVHGPSRRFGFERLVTLGLVVLAVGTVVRSLPALAPLWIGTALIGGGVAVCNVVLPSVVKRDFADRITLVTGGYSAVMGTFAALASGIALPVANVIGDGWRWSLGIWVIPTSLGAAIWAHRARTRQGFVPITTRMHSSGRSVWRSRSAWSITIYMGLQSTTFYVFVSWLPAIATSHRISSGAAGWYLFGYQVCGLLAGLTMPAVTHRLGAPARRHDLQPARRHWRTRSARGPRRDRAVGGARRRSVRHDVGRCPVSDEPGVTRPGLGRAAVRHGPVSRLPHRRRRPDRRRLAARSHRIVDPGANPHRCRRRGAEPGRVRRPN